MSDQNNMDRVVLPEQRIARRRLPFSFAAACTVACIVGCEKEFILDPAPPGPPKHVRTFTFSAGSSGILQTGASDAEWSLGDSIIRILPGTLYPNDSIYVQAEVALELNPSCQHDRTVSADVVLVQDVEAPSDVTAFAQGATIDPWPFSSPWSQFQRSGHLRIDGYLESPAFVFAVKPGSTECATYPCVVRSKSLVVVIVSEHP